MGRTGLPSISKIEDVLDLLTEPQKYQRYIFEFKAAYDEAKAKLADLDTKDKADQYLSEALEAHETAVKDKAAAQELYKKAQVQLDVVLETVRKERAEAAQELAKRQAGIEHQAQDLLKQRNAFDMHVQTKEAQLHDTQSRLDARSESLTKLELAVKQQKDKLEAALR